MVSASSRQMSFRIGNAAEAEDQNPYRTEQISQHPPRPNTVKQGCLTCETENKEVKNERCLKI